MVCIGGCCYFYLQKYSRTDSSRNDDFYTTQIEEDVIQTEKNIIENNTLVPKNRIVDSFSEDFGGNLILEETGQMDDSKNTDWWVNSGAFLFIENGSGRTIMGELNDGDKWQKNYKDYNADETDSGFHPQNIFRLVTRTEWKNIMQECYYKIDRYILSDAKERSASNGVLLFNRYQDGDNLYYTGVRVDGQAVIKKKYKGEYFTMAEKQLYEGQYNRDNNPNLLPLNTWIGVKSEVMENSDGTVAIKLFLDNDHSGNWTLALEVVDDGVSFGGSSIDDAGYAGIRTDFMDVEFDDYKVEEIDM